METRSTDTSGRSESIGGGAVVVGDSGAPVGSGVGSWVETEEALVSPSPEEVLPEVGELELEEPEVEEASEALAGEVVVGEVAELVSPESPPQATAKTAKETIAANSSVMCFFVVLWARFVVIAKTPYARRLQKVACAISTLMVLLLSFVQSDLCIYCSWRNCLFTAGQEIFQNKYARW